MFNFTLKQNNEPVTVPPQELQTFLQTHQGQLQTKQIKLKGDLDFEVQPDFTQTSP